MNIASVREAAKAEIVAKNMYVHQRDIGGEDKGVVMYNVVTTLSKGLSDIGMRRKRKLERNVSCDFLILESM